MKGIVVEYRDTCMAIHWWRLSFFPFFLLHAYAIKSIECLTIAEKSDYDDFLHVERITMSKICVENRMRMDLIYQ